MVSSLDPVTVRASVRWFGMSDRLAKLPLGQRSKPFLASPLPRHRIGYPDVSGYIRYLEPSRHPVLVGGRVSFQNLGPRPGAEEQAYKQADRVVRE